MSLPFDDGDEEFWKTKLQYVAMCLLELFNTFHSKDGLEEWSRPKVRHFGGMVCNWLSACVKKLPLTLRIGMCILNIHELS